MDLNKKNLIPLTAGDLIMLQWFGEWTPETHRADWKTRRRFPPGYREVTDTSVYNSQKEALAEANLSKPPRKDSWGIMQKLLSFRLIEGYIGACRLTKRGRAALKLHGKPAPERFVSHCAEIFDDVSLLPIVEGSSLFDRKLGSFGENLPDTAETWAALLTEYSEDNYASKGISNGPYATLTTPTGNIYLHGSLREHHQVVSITVSHQHHQIVEIMMSMEQLAELLTSNHPTPVTLSQFFDKEGMMQTLPAAKPVSAYERMLERMKRAGRTSTEHINEILADIESANIGKKLKERWTHELRIVRDNTSANMAYAVEQAKEEVSSVIETASLIQAERQAGALDAGRVLSEKVRDLIGAKDDNDK